MSDLISSTKNSLKKVVPNAKDILIKIEHDHGLFLSKIHIHIPGKILHAEKKADTIWEAIDYSYSAVLKQFEKIKTKRQARRKNKNDILSHNLLY